MLSEAHAAGARGISPDHSLRESARMMAHLAEHPALEDIVLNDTSGRLEHEVWVSVQMRGRPAVADPDMERFADEVARRFGWRIDQVEEIGWDDLPESWALIWEPA